MAVDLMHSKRIKYACIYALKTGKNAKKMIYKSVFIKKRRY
jgi:hypothetical protein